MEIQFFIPLKKVPTVTHQQKQVNFKTKNFYEPEELKKARAVFTGHLAGHKPERCLKGPVRLTVKWLFGFSGKTHTDGEYKTTKPDTDNLNKLLKDCMTDAGFWKDDAEVASEIIEKFWADTPGIWIRAEEL